ncbi:MAG: TrmB family transcriptional regulator [Candidatus Nomurabacteria bacterium]|nr:MAG: TrmB family transcriptional regulator [Candidatus Nomurabacteria bacterium]
MEYQEILQTLGLAKNEAKIYETLIRRGNSSVSTISEKSGVHRRNVYDSLNRLMEKGLVIEVVDSKENIYQAVEPRKLQEILAEKTKQLEAALPSLDKLYFSTPSEYRVQTYRGKEGWKQYMRDILLVEKPFYSIAAQGAWLDERVTNFIPGFLTGLKKKKIKMYHLFDYEVKAASHPIIQHVGKHYKFLPKKYATTSGIDIFGDRVNIMHHQYLGQVGEVDEIMFTVIQNQNLADSFRTWFQYMWDFCPEIKD